MRHLEEISADLYEVWGTFHLLPLFGEVDLGLIQRSRPLGERDARPGGAQAGRRPPHPGWLQATPR